MLILFSLFLTIQASTIFPEKRSLFDDPIFQYGYDIIGDMGVCYWPCLEVSEDFFWAPHDSVIVESGYEKDMFVYFSRNEPSFTGGKDLQAVFNISMGKNVSYYFRSDLFIKDGNRTIFSMNIPLNFNGSKTLSLPDINVENFSLVLRLWIRGEKDRPDYIAMQSLQINYKTKIDVEFWVDIIGLIFFFLVTVVMAIIIIRRRIRERKNKELGYVVFDVQDP